MPEPKRPLKVFLCHIIPLRDAHADKPKVRELYRTLRRRGMRSWLDTNDFITWQD
jgi:hypothetical protein